MNTRAVVIFSGGVDSTAAALWATEEFKNVELLTYRFGDERRQYGELFSAAQVASKLNLKHTVLDFNIPFPAYPITNQPFCQHHKMKDTGDNLNQHGVLPFNVALHLTYGASFAAMCGASNIVWGTIKDEADISADFTAEYSELVNSTLKQSGSVKTHMQIHTPIVNLHKWEVIETYRNRLDIFHATWSCKNSIDLMQCGECYGCEGRRIAARLAGLEDQTPYRYDLPTHALSNVTMDDIESNKVELKDVSELCRGSGKGVMTPLLLT